MVSQIRYHLGTLRGRLALGAAVLLALIGAATWIGYATVETLAEITTERFDALRESTRIGASLEGLIASEIELGQRYLTTGDPAVETRFTAVGRQADELRSDYKELPDLTPAERQQILAIAALHAEVVVRNAIAHDVYDIGRHADERMMDV
jgi:hypothetical protein